MKLITDPTFKYVPSASTDIRKTFARVRRQMREAADAEHEGKVQAVEDRMKDLAQVRQIKKAGKA